MLSNMNLVVVLMLLSIVKIQSGSVALMPPTKNLFEFIGTQYTATHVQYLNDSTQVPRYAYPSCTQWITQLGSKPFTGGFYAGIHWLMYSHDQSASEWAKWADMIQVGVAPIANNTQTHDVGFNIVSTYVSGFELTKNPNYLPIIQLAATSLSTRFSPIVGCTRSWNSPVGFKVIIDNMMNIELLFWAGKQFNNKTWSAMAFSHANTTMFHHFRKDNSTWHVVEYNETDGSVILKETSQGYANDSTWARGQSWAVHGYTIAYRYTGYQPFLDKAIGAAKLFLARTHHERSDSVPPWDFDAPANISIREVSAAAIVASGLIEMTTYLQPAGPANPLWNEIECILGNLSSPKYSLMGRPDLVLPAVLTQSVGSFPAGTEIGVAEIYADYYYTQALLRYDNVKKFYSAGMLDRYSKDSLSWKDPALISLTDYQQYNIDIN